MTHTVDMSMEDQRLIRATFDKYMSRTMGNESALYDLWATVRQLAIASQQEFDMMRDSYPVLDITWVEDVQVSN